MIKLLEEGKKIEEIQMISDEGFVINIPGVSKYTLLWWDPKKLSQACMNCAKQTKPFLDGLRRKGIEVYGVTLDDPSQNAGVSLFAFENHLRILTADIEIAELFGTYRGNDSIWRLQPHRAAFLIDSSGLVRKTWLIQHIPSFRDDLLKYISQLDLKIQEQQPSLFNRILSIVR